MALNDVTFVKGQGGLGRPLDGEDHISGLIYYVPSSITTLPSGFSTTSRIKTIFSLEEAEALGIKGDFSGESSQATATVTIASVPSTAASSVSVLVGGTSIGKASFTSIPADTTAIASAVVLAINAKTPQHGYSAASAAAVVTITAKKSLGDVLPTAPVVSVTVTGTFATSPTVTQFTGGADDPYAVLWYHISEFFRIQSRGVLYVGIYTENATFAEVSTIQNASDGKIRQLGIYTLVNLSSTQLNTLQAKADEVELEHKPLSILFAANVTSLASLSDLSTFSNGNVSVVIGQDGNALGNQLYSYVGKSITCLGAALGSVSRAKVSENIGWVKNFNLAADELDVIAFADGTIYRNVSESQLDDLNNKHYIFLRKHIGINGSYFNDSHTATSETSDYSTIENNRTIDKAIRDIRTFLIPELNGPLFVDPASGNLSEDTIAYFQNLAGRPLEQMERNGELSGFEVTINPTQNVLSTSKLVITVKLVPVGVARQIQVNIGFTVKLS